MTYILDERENDVTVKNGNGKVIDTISKPYTLPNDIIDAVVDDIGGNPEMKEAIKVIAKKDWNIQRG